MNLNSSGTGTGTGTVTETGTEIETGTDTQTQTEEGTNNNSENKQNMSKNASTNEMSPNDMSPNEMSKFKKLENILNNILTRIDNMEKTYVSLNADLIKQNIVMTELLNGKLKEPDFEMPDGSNESNGTNGNNGTNENGTAQKDLFYYESNNKIIVYGPGTYDNRSVLGPYGSWNSINKSWDLVIEKNILLEKIPYLIYKIKEMED